MHVKVLEIIVIKIKSSINKSFLEEVCLQMALKVHRSVLERISRGNTFQSARAAT